MTLTSGVAFGQKMIAVVLRHRIKGTPRAVDTLVDGSRSCEGWGLNCTLYTVHCTLYSLN